MHSHMQYGLGEDVSSFIKNNPEVVDLLICLTFCVACGDARRFDPYPFGVEVHMSAEQGKSAKVLNFVKPSTGATLEKDPAKVV